MQELGNGGHSTKASEARIARSELPALLLPQRRPRIDDPDRGKAPVVEPVNPPPRPEEAPSKPDPDYVNPTVGGQSA